MAAFTPYAGSGTGSLMSALLAPGSGITIGPDPAALSYAPGSVNFYDGSLAPLNIGAGLLLTSGITPGITNTVGYFGQDNGMAGDAVLDQVVNSVFQTQSYDATTLSFTFTVDDPTMTSISFDLVFGSDEYPEWVDQFVDVAVVMVNGMNIALFNHDPAHPLSVISSNLAAGYFTDNADGHLPIEYDGVSALLKFVAPIQPGVNTISIGIADTGDHIYDSGIFIANLTAGTIPGSGVVLPAGAACSNAADTVTGSAKDEYFDLLGGADLLYSGAGDDIVVAGAGNDTVFAGSGSDQIKGGAGDDQIDGGDGIDTAVFSGSSSQYDCLSVAGLPITIAVKAAVALVDGADSLTGVEFFRFSDGLFAIGPAGTLVPAVDPGGVPPDNYPGSLVLTGVGSEGQTLTSAVTDLDGIASPVDFQWSISLDEGATWAPIPGASMAEYVVGVADIGCQLRLSATYTDAKGVTEALTSAAKAIQPANDGDFSVLLIQLAAPAGASVMTPLTTLVQGAILLGLSPNLASASVKSVLGLEPSLNLQSYDAWAVLQSDPSDPQALALEKVAVQVAILASLWGDQSGLGISQAVVALALAVPAARLDLSSAADIASIMGLAIDDPLVVEIADRNWNIFEATSVAQIESVWLDILSVQDQIVSTTIGDLTAHINQAPQGIASALLPVATEDIACSVSASDLLIGLSDPDAGTLSIGSLVTDLGSVNTVDGLVFTVTAPANYNGPIELTYQVLDGQGGSTLATQLIVIAPVNDLPTGVVQIVGVAEVGKVLSVTQTLADADGIGPLHYAWTADGVAISGAADASSFTLTQDQAGKTVAVGVSYTDLQGSFETVFSAATDPVEGVGVTLNGTRRSDFLEGTQWDDVLNGLAGKDVLAGAAGNDTLNGGAGADILRGGADDDLYFVDNRSDQTLETMLAPATGDAGGVDTVKAEISWTLGLYIENLTLIGTRGIDGRGNALDNVMLGNAAGNALDGMGGNDVLAGGAGNDSLNGGAGADRYVFDSAPDARRNRDSIIDFTATDDSIVLDSAVFKAFGSPGPIAAENFGIGTSALSEQQFLVYDNQRGTLAYDADGNGAGFAIPFVVLMGAPTIDATDFLVF